MKERVQKTLGAQFGLRWMLWLLFAVTCMIGLIACSYAYQQRRSALLQELDLRLQRVASEYENLVDDFWSLYISVFSHQEDMLFFYRYFDQPSTEPLASEEKVELRPRIGLPQEMGYLSEAFFQAIEWAVREAERLGMQVILYDEGMYPSCSACGQVVAANPAFASRGIDWVPQPEEGDQVLAATPEGVLVSRFTRGTIRGIHFGEDDGEPGAPPSTDLLNPDAVDLFIRLTHEAYYRRLKPWFGGTIIAFFTDEPSIMGRDPRTPFAWTPGLEEETLETRVTFPGAACLGGYDLWEGRAFRLARGERCPIRLPRRGSLLVFACGAADWEALPLQPRVLWLEPAAFRLVEQRPEAVQKVYEAECVLPPDASNWDSIRLPVQAEEMCELTVNGQDAGAAFWSPCSFELAGLARPGANRLRLTVTGSLANRYGVRPVPYGLGVKETF